VQPAVSEWPNDERGSKVTTEMRQTPQRGLLRGGGPFSTPEGNVASSFEHFRDFIQKRMRMSHIYQPVMIRELLKSGGKASIRNIAAAFLSRATSAHVKRRGFRLE